MGIFDDAIKSVENSNNDEIPEFLKRHSDNEEYKWENSFSISDTKIKLLGMDNLGNDIIEKVKHLGIKNIECTFLSDNKENLNDSNADNKIFIDKNKGMSTYYEVMDEIINNAELIIQVMDLGTYVSTSLTDRLNYLCKHSNRKICYIGSMPFSFEGKLKRQRAIEQKEELKDESILVYDNDELIKTVEKNTLMKDVFEKRDKLIIEAIDYIINNKNRDSLETTSL